MKKIIFATGNADKMKEIREILADLDAEILSMKEAGIQADIVEDGKTFEENAVIKATAIGYEEKGENGFGYDPIFFLPEYGCTSAELSMEEKNKISHRGKALQAIKEELR